MPSALWAEIPAKNTPLASLNLAPIGSGPYKFKKYTVEKTGEVKSYILERNPDYFGQPAKIELLIFKFYHDAQSAVTALQNQNIEGLSFVPNHLLEEIEKDRSINLLRSDASQAVALFFNEEKQSLLKDKDIRKALAMAIDKQEIVKTIFDNHASVIDSPMLSGEIGFNSEIAKISPDISAAIQLIKETDYTEVSANGYAAKKIQTTEDGQTSETLEELTLILTTISQPTFIKTAEIIAEQAKKIGVKIQIEATEPSLLYEEVIKPRAYQILLTATQHGLDPDPYPFWHSSQTKDPGLNLSLYGNRKVDELLEKARTSGQTSERAEAYKEFQDIIAEDLPVIFLYQPTYAYAVSSKIKNISLEKTQSPTDRFYDIENWYIKTKHVLK